MISDGFYAPRSCPISHTVSHCWMWMGSSLDSRPSIGNTVILLAQRWTIFAKRSFRASKRTGRATIRSLPHDQRASHDSETTRGKTILQPRYFHRRTRSSIPPWYLAAHATRLAGMRGGAARHAHISVSLRHRGPGCLDERRRKAKRDGGYWQSKAGRGNGGQP